MMMRSTNSNLSSPAIIFSLLLLACSSIKIPCFCKAETTEEVVNSLNEQIQTKFGGEIGRTTFDDWLNFCPPGKAQAFPQKITVHDEYMAWTKNSCKKCLMGDMAMFHAETQHYPIVLELDLDNPPLQVPADLTFPLVVHTPLELAEFMVEHCWFIEQKSGAERIYDYNDWCFPTPTPSETPTATPTVSTSAPSTPGPTTPSPTTASPTTASPTSATPTRFPTPAPTTANPTSANPTVNPTTSSPTTATPTTVAPTTATPTTTTLTTANPTTDGDDASTCPNSNGKSRNCFNYASNPGNGNQGAANCPYADSDNAICDTSFYDELDGVSCRRNPNGKNHQLHCRGKVKCNTVGVIIPPSKNEHSNGTAEYDDSGNTECIGAATGYKAGDDCFYDGFSENWKVCEPPASENDDDDDDGDDDGSESSTSNNNRVVVRAREKHTDDTTGTLSAHRFGEWIKRPFHHHRARGGRTFQKPGGSSRRRQRQLLRHERIDTTTVDDEPIIIRTSRGTANNNIISPDGDNNDDINKKSPQRKLNQHHHHHATHSIQGAIEWTCLCDANDSV